MDIQASSCSNKVGLSKQIRKVVLRAENEHDEKILKLILADIKDDTFSKRVDSKDEKLDRHISEIFL